MTPRTRVLVAGLILLGILGVVVLLAFAGTACPVETAAQPCPDATRNVVTVIVLASLTTGVAVTPFAFLAELLARRRIIYRGAWWRAGRRGALAGLVIAALAGLRLGGTLSVPIAIFVIVLAAALEWVLARRDS
jgi:hypothetical protein